MPKIYRLADVFTLVSAPYQSFEIVLLEAMATNLPVVANNDPIRQEIVGQAGILVDPNDIDSYSKLLEKALRIDWKDKPKQQAERFSWEMVAKKYEDLFKEIMKT
jgi:hypothetical protein